MYALSDLPHTHRLADNAILTFGFFTASQTMMYDRQE